MLIDLYKKLHQYIYLFIKGLATVFQDTIKDLTTIYLDDLVHFWTNARMFSVDLCSIIYWFISTFTLEIRELLGLDNEINSFIIG